MWSVDKGKIRLLMDGEDFKAHMGKAKAAPPVSIALPHRELA
jgi:hypothetical protein